MVERLRGRPPVFDYLERARLIRALGYEVRESTEPGKALVDQLAPDVLAIGSDWARKDWPKRIGVDQDLLDERRIVLVYVPYTPGISSTEMKRRLRQ